MPPQPTLPAAEQDGENDFQGANTRENRDFGRDASFPRVLVRIGRIWRARALARRFVRGERKILRAPALTAKIRGIRRTDRNTRGAVEAAHSGARAGGSSGFHTL